jgi:CRISPR/Cas system-associated exonuclease Cas4 (RecB family)
LAVDTEQRPEPRQDKKALLFDHLAELQRRSKSESATASGLDRHQSRPAPPTAVPQLLSSSVAAATADEENIGCISGSSASPEAHKASQDVAEVKAEDTDTHVTRDSLHALGTDPALLTPSQLGGEQTCRRLVLETTQCQEGKRLRLLDASTGSISTCELRGQWATSPVVSGDVVNIVEGGLGAKDEGMIIDNDSGYMILQPDTLVTGTRVAQSFACERKVVLAAKLNSSVSSVAAMRGTMLHELFEVAVTKRLNTDDEYEDAISNVLAASMQTLYATGEDEHSTRLYMRGHVRLVQSWIRTYLHPGSETVDGKKIDSVLQAEENIWSPQFGLKGKVDLCVNLQRVDQGSLCPAALELKTGRKNPQEHQAQVMLYSLLMSQRYGVDVDTGLLLYLSSNLQEMGSVGQNRAAVIGIIMQRNSIALHIRTGRGDGRCRELPPMIMNAHQCGRCFQKDSCMLSHKAMEGGTAETSGVEGIFEGCVGNLTDRQLDYCRSQFQMIGAPQPYSLLPAHHT